MSMGWRREKNTSFFLRLEKSNYLNKVISKLELEDEIITDPAEILEEERKFYQKLYSRPPLKSDTSNEAKSKNLFLGDKAGLPKVTDNDRHNCEKEITETELLSSLKDIKNSKSPGSDGLTAEFYKFFWLDIKNPLLNSINHGLQIGCLSIEQRRGVLTLIPKKDKNRLFLKNWRPITLLNIDYKLAAKVLANRLRKCLPYIVDDDQTGYVKGRYIGCNIRTMEDILHLALKNNAPGILLTVDFEKAFDSISWEYMYDCLKAFGFGNRFIDYIKALYNDISTAVINNGNTSRWFYPERGVRQGCPISPYLFILAVETLSHNIRESQIIKGIFINNTEIKICQLADDTTCFVADNCSLKNLLEVFAKFKIYSGLSINIEKTKAKSLGPHRPESNSMHDLDWSEDHVTTLGVTLSGREEDHYILNFKKRLKNMEQLLNSWKCRRLSLKGKVTVINTLALAPLLYVASVVHVPQQVSKEVKSLVQNFLWEGKPAKIAYDTLTLPIQAGGLNLIDFEMKVRSLKLAWVKRLTDNSPGRWKAAPSTFLETGDLKFFFKCNRTLEGSTNMPNFYVDICKAWSKINMTNAPSVNVIRNQVIWNNRYITINNSPFQWQEWLSKGVVHIGDLLDENRRFLDHNGLNEKYGIACNFLNALQIRQSIPISWRCTLSSNSPNTNTELVQGVSVNIQDKVRLLSSCSTKILYQTLSNTKRLTPKCIARWKSDFPETETKDWGKIFNTAFRTTRETKLQTFQYKILHRIITCNKKLFDMKIKDSPECSYCEAVDNIAQFFVSCSHAYTFWELFSQWWSDKYHPKLTFPVFPSVIDILLGTTTDCIEQRVLNYCIIQGKYFIYTKKLFH